MFTEEQEMGATKKASIAIDLGTTFSGYALSFQHNKTDILTSGWSSGDTVTAKAPTCVLFDQGRRFRFFGYEAEKKYAELSRNEEHRDWFFFRNFKLLLHQDQEITEGTLINSLDGKGMAAIDVFSATISFLKEHALRRYQGEISENDVSWVLTVPAIWGDKARQFMRLAAERAGLARDSLRLALEPEAASIFCAEFVPRMRNRYLILDCGGGTVDIAVHELEGQGRLSAIYRPTGGVYGGIKVDDAFVTFLTSTCGAAVAQLTMYQEMELTRSFEEAKTTFALTSDNILLPLPYQLRATFDPGRKFAGKADLSFDRLSMSRALMSSFFQKPVEKILQLIREVLSDPLVRRVDAIYMVGGFSLSPVLQQAVRDAHPDIPVTVPEDPASAVVKGAVLYGHEPRVIRTRRSAYTYGLKACRDFISGLHLPCKRFVYDNEVFCIDLFDKLVTKNDTLELGITTAKKSYTPAYETQDSLNIEVYRSTEKDPYYVTDFGCELVGKLRVRMPKVTEGLPRSLDVAVMFGDSELKVEAVDSGTMQKYTAEFDFLVDC